MDSTEQPGTGFCIGDGLNQFSQFLRRYVIAEQRKALPKRGQQESGVLSGSLRKCLCISCNVLLKAGHRGRSIQKQKIQNRRPGLPDCLQISRGSKSLCADAGLCLGDGSLIASDIHIGVQGIPVYKGSDQIGRCRRQGISTQRESQDQGQSQCPQPFHRHSSTNTVIREKLSL